MRETLKRLPYIIPGLFFIWIFIDFRGIWFSKNSLGLNYLIISLIPALIFTYQSIRNSKIGWFLIMILWLTYFVMIIVDFKHKTIDLLGIKTNTKDVLINLFLILGIIAIGYVYYKLKPKRG
jgi:hypothetical protein